MTFLHPTALLLLPLAVAVALLPLVRGRARARRVLPAALRALLLAFLVLALAEPRAAGKAHGRAVAFVVDVSRSVPDDLFPAAAAWIDRQCQTLAPSDTFAVLLAADGATVEAPFDPPGAPPPDLARPGARLGRDATDLGAAIRLALAGFPEGTAREIVILSDGNENRGDAVAEARRARAEGASLLALPFRYRRDAEVAVVRVEAPPSAPPGAVLTARPLLLSARDGVPARLRLFVDGREIAAREVTLSAGKSRGPEFRFTVESPGFHEVSVALAAEGDTVAANNEARTAVRVSGSEGVLVAEGGAGQELLSHLLEAAGIGVRRTSPRALPDNPLLYQPYDAVVLSDVPAFDLSERQLDALEVAVRDMGVGALVLGGENAYGPGGYRDTALERLLPVRTEIREKQVLLNGALVLILHTCEFDRGNYWAATIAEESIRALSPQDFVGLITYGDDGDEWSIPLARVAVPAALAANVPTLSPGDMPSFDSSLTLAADALRQCAASVKHIVVISDGDAAQPDSGLLRSLAVQQITVSAVCVAPHGESDAATMQLIATAGRGRYYRIDPDSTAALPKIFIQEATTLRRAAVERKPFVPELAATGPDAHPALRGFPARLPKLEAFCLTEVKERAEATIVTPNGDPVMAFWRYGLAETAAFTSAVRGGWLGEWAAWPDLGRFFAQTVREIARRSGRSGFAASAEVTRGVASVRLRAVSETGEEFDFLNVQGTLVRPGDDPVPFAVLPRGGGLYEGTAPARPGESAIAVLRFTDPATGLAQQAEAAVGGAPPEELLDFGTNDAFFARLAAEAGAVVLASADPLPPPPAARGARPRDLAPLCLVLAALLLPLDLLLRRFRPDFGRLRAALAGAFAKTPAATPSAAAAPDAPDAPRPEAPPDAGPGPAGPPSSPPPGPPPPDRLDALRKAKDRARKARRWEDTSHKEEP